jgi:hypothetical protein
MVKHLVKAFHHRVLHRGLDPVRTHTLTKSENTLNHTQFRRSSIQPCDGHPVIDDHTGSDNATTSIYTARHQRDLKQAAQLILVLNTRLGMDEAPGIAQGHVRAGQDIVCDGLAKDLDAEDVGNDFLRLAFNVRMYEGYAVVCADDVAKSREPLFYSLDLDVVWKRVSEMLELLVRRRGWNE